MAITIASAIFFVSGCASTFNNVAIKALLDRWPAEMSGRRGKTRLYESEAVEQPRRRTADVAQLLEVSLRE